MTIAVYAPVCRFGFVQFDDQLYVYQNPHVLRGLTGETAAWAFTTVDVANYHPLTWLSWLLDVSLVGVRPGYFHVENVAIHAANSILLFVFLRRATGDCWPSAFAAFVFAVHPAHVESVAWISERKDVLCTLFGLTSMLCYLQWVRTPAGTRARLSYAAMLLCFVLSLLSKQMWVTLPFLLILLDYWPLRRSSVDVFKLTAEKVPLFLLSIAAGIVSYLAQRADGTISSTIAAPPGSRLQNVAVAYSRYIFKSVWPVDLCSFYPYHNGWPLPVVVLSVLLLTAVTLVSLRLRRRAPYLIVGWLWFLGVLVPVIGLIQIGSASMADRYLYVPMIGLTIGLAWGANDLAISSRSIFLHRGIALTGVAVIGVLAILAHRQVGYWRDTRTLFSHALSIVNDDESAHIQMASLVLKEGDSASALSEYQQAARLAPRDFTPEYDIANLLLDHPQDAIPHYQRALILRPHHARTENNLGIAFARIHRPELASQMFQAAMVDDPAYADPHSNLALVLESAGRLNAAAAEFTAALRIDPSSHIAKAGAIRSGAQRREH